MQLVPLRSTGTDLKIQSRVGQCAAGRVVSVIMISELSTVITTIIFHFTLASGRKSNQPALSQFITTTGVEMHTV